MHRQRRLSAAALLLALTTLPAGPADAATLSARQPDGPVADVRDHPLPHDNRSPAQERAMLDHIRRNVAALRRSGVLAPADDDQSVTFDFPLRPAPGLPEDAGFFVSALADHDPAAGKVLDYHGGSRTYDGHRAIDIALWPFPWNKLDAGEMQVIAAAAGTIVAKSDANPADHNCGQPGGGDWNYIALEHADGRMTIYGHMRYHSLTAKGIGQAVARGELLGTAASSGNSSGPHLHFEVRAASLSQVWIDPFAGPHSQSESLWTEQAPYLDSAINRLATHAGPPSTPDLCKPTVTRLQDSFSTPGTVYIYAYYRDYQGALPTEVRVHRPDGTVFRSWSHTDDTAFSRATSRAWVAQLAAGDPAGTWRVEATYNGRVHATFFNVGQPPALALTKTAVDPNPEPGAATQYILRLTNNGLGSATQARLTDALPAGLAQSGPITLDPPGLGTVGVLPAVVTDLTLAAGQTLTVTIPVVLATGQPAGQSITNTADLTSAEVQTPIHATAVLTVADAPLIARDDLAQTVGTAPVTIPVLANDADPNGDPLTLSSIGLPANGAAIIAGPTVRYTARPGFVGTDAFTYTVSTGREQAVATVRVIVLSAAPKVLLPLLRR